MVGHQLNRILGISGCLRVVFGGCQLVKPQYEASAGGRLVLGRALVHVGISVGQQCAEVVQPVLAALFGGTPAVHRFTHIASVHRVAQHFYRRQKVQAAAQRS